MMKNEYKPRRKFIKNIFFTLFSLQIIYLFGRLLGIDISEEKETNLYDAGDLTFFQKGKVYPFGAENMFVCCLEDGGILAVSSKCTHLGCSIQFNSKHNRFECPCHASAFDQRGKVLSPPAIRALDYYPVTIKNNRVFVDTHQALKRKNHLSSQVTYA